MTSHAAIEAAAFHLFTDIGFDRTTTEQIAEAAGIGRRTLFRYFPSKYDIPWGRFDASLAEFRRTLAAMPASMPLWQAVQQAVVSFNALDPAAIDQHRIRMTLILRTPSLQEHSVLMYARWREVIAEYVADRLGLAAADLLPQAVGHVSLALSITAYEQWLRQPDADLGALLSASMDALREYVGSPSHA